MSGTQLTKDRKNCGMKIIKDQGKKSEMLEEKNGGAPYSWESKAGFVKSPCYLNQLTD